MVKAESFVQSSRVEDFGSNHRDWILNRSRRSIVVTTLAWGRRVERHKGENSVNAC